MNNRKDRTIFDRIKLTGDLAKFVLQQEGLTCMDDWGGIETVREILPENLQTNFDGVQPALIDTILKEKNKKVAGALLDCFVNFVDFCNEGLDAGKQVVYHYFPISIEIFLAMDLIPICYEISAGLLAPLYKDGVEPGIDRLEAEGYPDHLCSAQKGTAGFLLMGQIPKPDVIVKSATPCDTSNKLYEWTAHKFDAPLVTIETPYYRNDRGVKFIVGEVKRLVERLEKLTGKTLDEDKLRHYCKIANEAIDYILKTQELKKLVPCPDTGWHRPAETIFLTQLGTPMGLNYFRTLYEDVKARADRGEGVIPKGTKEKRFAWGYTWEAYDLTFFEWLEQEHGATYTVDTLTYMHPEVGFVDTTSTESMIEGLAWRILQMPMGRQSMGFSDVWVDDFVRIVKEFSADALIIGGHMACKHFWALNKLLSDKVKEETGVPTLRFEMDMLDKRFTPSGELKRVMEEFLTTL